jgi:pectin methylesterase-like acyl-CoA thioesterase
MAAPTYIAVNLTGFDVQLVQLAVLVPASGQIILSDCCTTSEIQEDRQLRDLLENDTLLISDGTTTFSKTLSVQYLTPVASPTVLNPMTTRGDMIFGGTSPAGAPTRLGGTNGAYFRSGGTGADPTMVRVLDVDGLVADVSVGTLLDASAIIQMNSTTKGMLLPRMTHAQMMAIASPAVGLLVYVTDAKRSHFWDGVGWRSVAVSIATVISVAVDGSGDFTSIQDALDSILDAADDNRYVVEVTPGGYTENVALKDYVSVNGTGWDTLIHGTVTATDPVEMQMIGMHVESTNVPAFIQTGATAADGESDLLGCFLGATYDDTVAGGVVRCTISQDSGLLYLYRECEATLIVNDTVNTSASTFQAIFYAHGTDQVTYEAFNTWETLETNNPGNDVVVNFNKNTHAATAIRDIGYSATLTLTGTSHANYVCCVMSLEGNGMILLSRKDYRVDATSVDGIKVHVVCSMMSPDSCRSMAKNVTIFKSGIPDANMYVGASTTANDLIEALGVQYQMDADVLPDRDIVDGALGMYRRLVSNNFGTTGSTGLFNGAEVNADVTDWDNVRDALGGEAGANPFYVFQSDGLGGGSMVMDVPKVFHRLSVGISGNITYTSIKTAIDAAIAGGCSASNVWEIEVYPGTYTEAPMTLVPGIALRAADNRIDTAFIVASNNAADLFTCTGGYMSGFVVSGVTDATKALFRMATASTQTVFHGVRIFNCSSGWVVSGGATCLLNTCSTVLTGAGQGITTWASVSGSGSYLGVAMGVVSVVAALLPAYAGNPIQTVFRAANSAKLLISGATYRVAPKNATADILLADTGAQVTFIASEIADSGNALHIGSSGSDTKVIAPALALTNNLLNVFIESATGVVFVNFSTDIERKSIVSGGQLMGMVQYRDDNTWRLIGNGDFRFATGKDVDLTHFFYDYISTGICEGGAVTAGTGLHVDVALGEGFIRRGAPNNDAFSVSWTAVTALLITASSTNYIYYDSADSTVKAALSAPGVTGILLATVVTDGSGIRFIHSVGFLSSDFGYRFNQYLLDTRKFAAKTGIATSQGTGATKLAVSAGSYYLSMNENPYAGSGGDATWSYFYGTNGATEVASVTSLNTTQYDNAGTLTAMTGSYFRADTLYVTSDGRLSLIYGNAQFATQALAEEDTAVRSAPTFIEPSGCRLAQVVVQQGVGISVIVDRRPNPGSTAGGGGGSGSHSALADLDKPADHAWAMLVDGTRSMTGGLNMGGNAISNVGNVDGVDVSAHAARHLPGGADALTTATPVAVTVGSSPAEGSATNFARGDHQHGVAAGVTPGSVGTANAEGSSSSVARADHVHNHGAQTSGTLHAAAIAAGANGFMSGTDKTKLDSVASGATNTPLTSSAPANVTKATAAVGVATDAARADHKHDITTAAAAAQAPGDTAIEGVAISLARSDHRHSLPAFGTTGTTFCVGNDSRLSDDRTASGLRSATTVVAVSAATAPTAGQVLTATAGNAANWQTPSGIIFGANFQTAVDETTTSTTSSSYQDKVTMTTPALTGTYRVSFYCEVATGSSNTRSLARLYNVTDATELCLHDSRDSAGSLFQGKLGFQYVTFAGVAKVFKIQFASQAGVATISCRRARIELWRVS